MTQRLSLTALLVRDYDEAIDFYVRKVGFELRHDTDQGGGKRWVVVGPGGGGAGILLAKPTGGRGVGEQGAGRVFLFLETDDFDADHARMTAAASASSSRRPRGYGDRRCLRGPLRQPLGPDQPKV